MITQYNLVGMLKIALLVQIILFLMLMMKRGHGMQIPFLLFLETKLY